MQKNIQLVLSPEQAADRQIVEKTAARRLKISTKQIQGYQILKKSIDARQSQIKINLKITLFIDEAPSVLPQFQHKADYKDVKHKPEVHIAGAGPAGLFAALRLIELGYKPVVFERGKDVSSRKRDIAAIHRQHKINPESNYCFGEGGAGAFSDGKLYTRSKKRGDVQKILQSFHYHGADENILYESHPHIGTDKLPGIIKNMRETIQNAGGQIIFNTKVSDIIIEDNTIKAIKINENERLDVKRLILATGHSARDIYELLDRKNIAMKAKPFAVGVRVEHPQNQIDRIQYHGKLSDELLPAASYNVAVQVENRGVYSFCMCPGGFIVPSATVEKTIVVNGMSPAKRNSPFANAGIVVEIKPSDLEEYAQFGELAGLKFQEKLESMAYLNSGNGQVAPAQQLADFVKGKLSATLPPSSYHPGLVSSPLHFWLPHNIGKYLQKGFKLIDRKMKGFVTNEAIAVGVESRTSSPITILRKPGEQVHVQIEGLFPCGEGAGYAGGIVSSAIDGEQCAEYAVKNL